jgi:glycosyltransferase involved in cell wall biosynthesis
MPTPPLLSVVIPTWNRARLVCEAVESALAQRPGSVEVIVVDDGSTDGTREVLARRFGDSIRVLSTGRRGGPGAARNAGVGEARGELLAFLDSDDLWLPGKLDAELRVLERFPDAEVVVSDSLNFIEGRPDELSRFAQNGLLAATGGQPRPLSACRWLWTNIHNNMATCSITLRRAALRHFDGPLFAEDLTACEDWEFELRLHRYCRVVVLPEVLASIRRFDDGSRPGRAMHGTQPTREQRIGLLRDRLTVMERAHWLDGLDADLAGELLRLRDETSRQLIESTED